MTIAENTIKSTGLLGGIEAGGTKFNCIVADESTKIIERIRIPTTTPDETLGCVNDFFKVSINKHGPLIAMGVGCFGPLCIDSANPMYGHILNSPKEAWKNVNIRDLLLELFDVPMGFDTDVNAATLAEGQCGAAKDVQNYVYVTVGTGIGAGIVINGELVSGAAHPEIGHMLVPQDTKLDDFGGVCPFHRSCVEGLASGTAIEARWKTQAAYLPATHPAWDLEASYLAMLCMNIVVSYSPEKIIIGGGVMQQDHLFRKIRVAFLGLINSYHIESLYKDTDEFIVPPCLYPMSGEVGTLLLAKNTLKQL